MGICYNYIALTTDLLHRVEYDPSLTTTLINREFDEPEPEGVLSRIDVDKAWDAVAYLLSAERRATDNLYPATDLFAQAVLGGDDQFGYGSFEEGFEPAVIRESNVRKIAQLANSVSLVPSHSIPSGCRHPFRFTSFKRLVD